ncbi:hypothetical protein CDD83_9707 [Cordyceps sp. RAO-2017]|nr:hypothetical protein CDD83_9707 [Cordyceps sp. RAO-2017]
MNEWADYRCSSMPRGYSPYGGQTYGAYYPKMGADGSSSGSAVSADIGLAFAALATETSGSITHPAMRNSVVGIKPTVGLVSRHLVIPGSEHRDTVGPIARTVRDAAQVLQVIAGPDAADNYTAAIPGPVPDYVAACNPDALRGARIGVPYNVFDDFFELSPPDVLVNDFVNALKTMEASGATIVAANLTRPFGDRTVYADAALTGAADLMANLPAYFAQLTENPSGIKTIEELREKTRSLPAEENNFWGTSVWDDALEKFGFNNTDPRFWPAYQRLQQFQGPEGVLGALERDNLHALVLPAVRATDMVNHIGAPVVTVPLGYDPIDSETNPRPFANGNEVATRGPSQPYALSFVGRHWSEADLVGLAYSFEQKTQVRGRAKRHITPEAEITVSSSCYSQ